MNVLLQDWEFPPFDHIHTEDYEPAIRAAIEEAERNVEAIATSKESPTFENTVEALECASRRLDRISAIMLIALPVVSYLLLFSFYVNIPFHITHFRPPVLLS